MHQMMRRAALALFALAAAIPSAALTARPQSLAAVYRDELAQATGKLKWSGPSLSHETLLAVAAGGLSWKTEWQSAPLFVQDRKGVAYADSDLRRVAFLSARQAGNDRFAVPFALSLALDPGALDPAAWRQAFDYLSGFGDDFDAILIGIEQAPQKLALFPAYSYAAADLLVWRASPRLLPFLLTMADSSDRYLRSRGVAALGIAGYDPTQSRSAPRGLLVPLYAGSISANQRGMVDEILRRSAGDKNYRVRAAAALALGLAGSEEDLPLLEKLARDRAYLALPGDDRNTKRICYPVRNEAVRALARFGRTAPEPPGGALSGKELKQATRGGSDVTRDTRDIRTDRLSRVRFCDGVW